jgi:polar amino acid transport system substrate-binding protein
MNGGPMGHFISLFLLVLSNAATAEVKPKISLCVGDWEGYSNPELTGGAYIDLMNSVFADHYDMKWFRYSFSKCHADFSAGKIDVLVGENKSDSRSKGTVPYDAAYLSAVYLEKKIPSWDDSKILNSRKLAWVRGYGFERMIQGKSSFTEVNTLNQGVRQLLTGRFDVYLDDDIDAITRLLELPEFKGKGIKVTETKVKEIMVLVFKDTPDAKNLIKLSDERITAMRKSGQLKTLFETKYKLTYVE